MSQTRNRLLVPLPSNVIAALEGQLDRTALGFGDLVAEDGERICRAYCPVSGAISRVVHMRVADMIETVGRDGVANATSVLDGNASLHTGGRPAARRGVDAASGRPHAGLTCSEAP